MRIYQLLGEHVPDVYDRKTELARSHSIRSLMSPTATPTVVPLTAYTCASQLGDKIVHTGRQAGEGGGKEGRLRNLRSRCHPSPRATNATTAPTMPWEDYMMYTTKTANSPGNEPAIPPGLQMCRKGANDYELEETKYQPTAVPAAICI